MLEAAEVGGGLLEAGGKAKAQLLVEAADFGQLRLEVFGQQVGAEGGQQSVELVDRGQEVVGLALAGHGELGLQRLPDVGQQGLGVGVGL